MPTTITSGAASAKGYGFAASQSAPVYVEDVFSTYLYTGTGASQTITNGVDLSTKGGLVWIKSRSGTLDNTLFDTARGAGYQIYSNLTLAQSNQSTSLSSFGTSGFSLGADNGSVSGEANASSATYASWTFRKQPKFFDIVTYTGNGSNRTISHNLGSVPGCIIVKRTDTTGNWQVYHRSLANTEYIVLNSAAGKATGTDRWNSTTATDTAFSLGTNDAVNANTGTYVAYLFAHDAGGFGLSGTDSVVKCGSYTGNGSATGPVIDLGWEPQFVVIKTIRTDLSYNWLMFDNMRGVATGGADAYLSPSLSSQEDATTDYLSFNSTGFQITRSANAINSNGQEHIYIAIRRGPMKTPTDATKVFQSKVYTGTNVDNRLVTTDIVTDMVMVRQRDDTVLGGMVVGDRLRGQPYLLTGAQAAEVNDADSFDQEIVSAAEYGTAFSSMTGFWVGNDATAKLNANTTSNNHVALAFKRAPGFFDCVCYSGTGSLTTKTHNLGVAPELLLIKRRNATDNTFVYSSAIGANQYLMLNLTSAAQGSFSALWNDTSPTSTVFTVNTDAGTNSSSGTYVAYLFATCAGVSKVGSYTGTGTTKQIDCGFTGGTRFVMIKRTDSTGDWYVWDTARGIIAANDPYLLLNSTAAEVTDTDYIDPYSAGFEISSTAPAAINANGGTFIYLAIA